MVIATGNCGYRSAFAAEYLVFRFCHPERSDQRSRTRRTPLRHQTLDAPYQGMTSVVPKKTMKISGFSPCSRCQPTFPAVSHPSHLSSRGAQRRRDLLFAPLPIPVLACPSPQVPKARQKKNSPARECWETKAKKERVRFGGRHPHRAGPQLGSRSVSPRVQAEERTRRAQNITRSSPSPAPPARSPRGSRPSLAARLP